MYGVNASVPKTLVRTLIKWASSKCFTDAKEVLEDILDTPISPELMPTDADGNIVQLSETVLGPYELNDFFLYQIMRWGFEPAKVFFLARKAFAGIYDEDIIRKYLDKFYGRFFSQQFKRSCLPDGPKVGSVSLSPRGDWRMPSDVSPELWREELEKS
jgi:NAD+ synthase (glutamine-hydrolysing)